ncbi:MAG: peptidylprolyl isomerase [Geobacteraceae bacterium GWC2_58_44]|nr:MAG: peptidylprolyl isomerase [Geobacteraceae bacterium GWC2_58_44]HBG05198.1 peptidylprolyl isomerase [Geobacter sp.]
METANGTRVKIRFKCRLQDGKVYLVGARDTLDFVIGAGSVPPALETGVLGMKPRERRTIRVPAAEVNLFPFPRGSHFAMETESPPGTGYEFGPGEGGDVSLSLSKPFREPLPTGADLYFEVEMLAVEGMNIN